MRASVLTIGNEILNGRTINSNLAHIGRVLTYAGYEVYRALTVRDDPKEIAWSINTALSFSDLVVTSGGLGPTFDDMTIESISDALGIPLEINQEELEKLKSRYIDRHLELTESRLKMVKLPKGSTALNNPIGAAPGVLLTHDGKRILILPGVPGEMEAILDSVIDEIRTSDVKYYEETFPLDGIMESSLAPLVNQIMKKWSGKVYIKSHPKRSEIANPSLEIQIYSSNEDPEVARKNVKEVIKYLKEHYLEYAGK